MGCPAKDQTQCGWIAPHDEDPGLVSSRARTTQEIVKPYDFVLAPILQTADLDPEQRAEKPILITRFTDHSDEWLEW